ncbi:MAG: hypothetical protein J0M33_25415 [Anaerolineae bacterium]|nr:hypothetical protein [Anaerolineae bacterium]
MQYIIAPIGESTTEFRLDSSYLAQQLRHHWPGVEVRETNPGNGQPNTSWAISITNCHLIGDYWQDDGTILLDASNHEAADFALWYRTMIPIDQRIWIFDDLGNHSPYEIQAQTLKESIVKALT